ncbi:MAG: ISAs1 family transposase [Betaproteobacteria bacterium]|nr:ISAs1 family transposase [Betaproteobacteria bacterium]
MAKNLVEHFSIIEDPRRGRVAYELTEILVIVTCALFSEVETFVDIAYWARVKEPWLRRFLRLRNGLPSHDTMNRVFRLLDPKVFATVFADWVSEAMPSFSQVAIDGKSLRGAQRKGQQGNPIHLVSAFAIEAGLSLPAQCAVTMRQRAWPSSGGLSSTCSSSTQRIRRKVCAYGANSLVGTTMNACACWASASYDDGMQSPWFWVGLFFHAQFA